MLTKNGRAFFVASYDSNGYPNGNNNLTMINTSGQSKSSGGIGWGNKNMMEMVARMNLVVGSGTTAPTSADYVMESEISSLTVVSSSNSGNRSPISYAQDYIHSCSKTYKNSTANPITVSEVGIYISNVNNIGTFLIAREVLETPVTIAPGKTYSFSMVVA